ncbi:cysteine-rich protein 1 [Trichonephila clavipes]|nr:cysteine-rich protein 1 [Trichonephila clavipes]
MWKCHKCGKPVFAEHKTSLGYEWHPECLRCEECGKRLNPGQHAEHKGVPYCHVPCYSVLFGPTLFGHGSQVEAHTSFGKNVNRQGLLFLGSPKPNWNAKHDPQASGHSPKTRLCTINNNEKQLTNEEKATLLEKDPNLLNSLLSLPMSDAVPLSEINLEVKNVEKEGSEENTIIPTHYKTLPAGGLKSSKSDNSHTLTNEKPSEGQV